MSPAAFLALAMLVSATPLSAQGPVFFADEDDAGTFRDLTIRQLVDAADRGGDVELHEKDTPDIASFLKKFFALLPAPVIPGDLVDRFGESRSDPKALCLELRQIVDQVLLIQ